MMLAGKRNNALDAIERRADLVAHLVHIVRARVGGLDGAIALGLRFGDTLVFGRHIDCRNQVLRAVLNERNRKPNAELRFFSMGRMVGAQKVQRSRVVPVPHLSLYANTVAIGNKTVQRLDVVANTLGRYAKDAFKIWGDIERKTVAGTQDQRNVGPLLRKRLFKQSTRSVRVALLV